MRPTVKYRTRQQLAWLIDHYPTPYPVVLRWAPKIAADPRDPPRVRRIGYYGETYWVSPNIVIRLSSRLCRTLLVAQETLNHEYAHAMVLPNNRVYNHPARNRQEHPDEWALAYGRVYRGWVDDGGSEESRHYEV